MGSSSTQTQNSTQEKAPWAPAIPALKSIINQVGARVGDANLSPTETSALDYLSRNAQAGNPFASNINSLAGDLFSGGTNYTPQINANMASYQQALTPFARGDYVNPNSNPALQSYLDVIRNDVTNSVNGMYAGAGRDFSGANFQALGRGVAQAQAPVLLDAYNKALSDQQSAIDKLYGAGNTTTGLLSNLDQLSLQNRQAGIGVSDAALKAQNYGANQQLAIEAQRRGIPMSMLSQLAGIMGPLAQLGGTTNSNSTSTTESFNPVDWAKVLIGGQGIAPYLAMSDERTKEDIAPIGRLYDGTPVYSYNYRGDPTPRVGLIAQDVERRRPDAVTMVGGFKAVDHRKATARARRIGGLLDQLSTR